LDVVAVGQAGLFLAHFQARLDGVVVAPAIEEEIGEGFFLRVGLLDIGGEPIGNLAVGDRVLDNFDEGLGGNAGGLEPGAIKAVGEILLVIRVQFAGQMKADFINEAGEISPARHRFARAARVNQSFHKNILSQGPPAVNASFSRVAALRMARSSHR